MKFGKYTALFLMTIFLSAVPAFLYSYTTEEIGVDPARKDFVIGPGKQEIFLKPGQSATVDVMVSNRMGEERVFTLEVEDFKGSRDISKTVELLGEETGPFSLKNYIQFSEKTFTLKNGTRARIPVKISIPTNAEPGGFYGSLLVSTVKSPESTSTDKGAATAGVPINVRQGVLFFVRVEGDVNEDGKVVDFKIGNNKSFFSNKDEINFQIIFENNGSVHLNPYGTISITNSIGQEVNKIELEPWFTMPDSLRSRETKISAESMVGKYSAIAHIYRGFGPLDNSASYDDVILSFWVIPWVKIGWYGFGVLLILFVLSWIKRNFEFRRK